MDKLHRENVTAGVLKGSVLVSPLFLTYKNDCKIFADGTSFFLKNRKQKLLLFST